ncbi:MAG: NAD(+)/NADH kinase [Clostridiaceae bacterium]|jgi:NAD+ kinase|nr:NAD(+)/NADH kinase [Bacillota bacterium]NLN51284.1 NAD(+)/NADH kinase [Clostridiaceae bacterium]
MKRIAIYPNRSRDPDFKVTNLLVEEIVKHGGTPILEPELAGGFRSPHIEFNSYSNCDLIICLGGDGTFLSAAHHPSAKGLPQMGVNLGSVGFLAEIEPDQIIGAVPLLLRGEYQIEKRMMLDVKCYDNNSNLIDHGYALNDVVLCRGGGNTGILTVDLCIDDNSVERIPGDGMIVSTPTGSTAYNLAAGGPIVHPQVNIILITPLAPHTLHNRTYIASDQAVVKMQLVKKSGPAIFSIDGRQDIEIEDDYYVLLSGSDFKFSKIRLDGDKFYQTLSSKIQLRGQAR